MTAFFVPGVEPEHTEARYGELARLAGAEVVPPGARIRSVRFARDAEEWTATVGRQLSGELGARPDRRPARRSGPGRRATDPATVQAIVEVDDAYRVLTDAPPVGPIDDSTFGNPFSIPRRDARGVGRFTG